MQYAETFLRSMFALRDSAETFHLVPLLSVVALRLLHVVCLFIFGRVLLRAEANRKALKVTNKAKDVKQGFY